jgi:hypothetical protein
MTKVEIRICKTPRGDRTTPQLLSGSALNSSRRRVRTYKKFALVLKKKSTIDVPSDALPSQRRTRNPRHRLATRPILRPCSGRCADIGTLSS